jgi:enoyl-CoA hydratase
MSAEEAFDLGLLNQVVDEGEALPVAISMAQRLAAAPPYAIQSTKVAVNKYIKAVSNLVLPVSLALEEVSMTKSDHSEAVKAFQEKREPNFTGT